MEEQNAQENVLQDNIVEKKTSKVKLWIFLTIMFVLGAITSFTLIRTNTSKETIVTKAQETVFPTPTPMPFADLTIPYLRNKEYNSNLSELSVLSVDSNYTQNLTSYTSDGLKINGLLTVPTGQRPQDGWPAIVFVHGYIPPATYQTTQNYYAYVDYLARNGFVVFKIDLRGHGNSEGEASGAYYSGDYIVDVLNAYSALQNSDFVNPNKIGLWGHSMAGNVLLRAMAVRTSIPAAVIWGGAVYTYDDWKEFGIQDGSYRPPANNEQRLRRREQLMKTHGEFDNSNEFWKQVAATNYLQDIKGAIQLNHAVNDDVVNVGYSRNLDKILDATSIPHELHEYPSGGHNISDPSFGPAMQDTVSFFEKYLK